MSCYSATLICVSKHIRFAAGHDRRNETQWANRHFGVGEGVRELLTRSGYMLVITERVQNGPTCAIIFNFSSLFLFLQPHPQL